MGRSSAEKVVAWRDIQARQAESGLSVAAFCRNEGIPAWKFNYWRQRLAKLEVASQLDASETIDARGMFAELVVANSGTHPAPLLEIAFPGDIHVRFYGAADEAVLRAVVRAVRSTC